MIASVFWSIVLRTAQVAVEASPTLFCGFLVAGVMRRMLGAEGTRRLFGGSGWKGLMRAWGVGTLLPVCSLGVIPIAREMRRSGVPSGIILAFMLAAPHINPLSLLYGLTLSEPLVIICFALGSLVVSLSAGLIWDRIFARKQEEELPKDEPVPAPGVKRLASVVLAAGREAVGSSMAFAAIGILFTGLVAGLLPCGYLSHTMLHHDWWAPAQMTAAALPLYIGSLPGMMRLGLMFEHGNSVGAAFALFELGIGLNVGVILWLCWMYGARRVLPWLALIVVLAVGLAYAMDRPLDFAQEEAGHTHAFDDWSSPWPFNSPVSKPMVRDALLQKIEVLEPVALAGLALLLIIGSAARAFDRTYWLEAWLMKAPPVSHRPVAIWNRPVPGPVLGVLALLGLVVFSVVALYIYYPSPEDAASEIRSVHANAYVDVRTGQKDDAIRHMQQLDLWSRKLQVGVFIRTGHHDPRAAQITDDFRERLEDVRDAMIANDFNKAKSLLPKMEESYHAWREVYRGRLGNTEAKLSP